MLSLKNDPNGVPNKDSVLLAVLSEATAPNKKWITPILFYLTYIDEHITYMIYYI